MLDETLKLPAVQWNGMWYLSGEFPLRNTHKSSKIPLYSRKM